MPVGPSADPLEVALMVANSAAIDQLDVKTGPNIGAVTPIVV
jgi:hypothetical protein